MRTTFGSPCSGRLLWGALTWALFLLPAELLRLAMSFNGMAGTMSKPLVKRLVRHLMKVPSNIPALILYAEYGDNGLRGALKSYAERYSSEILAQVLVHCVERPKMQPILLSEKIRDRLLTLYGHVGAENVNLHTLLHSSRGRAKSNTWTILERYHNADPHGYWWPSYLARHGLPKGLKSAQAYKGSIFQLGMLDVLDSSLDVKSCMKIYVELCGMNRHDPVKQMWSLYGLMRLHHLSPHRVGLTEIVVPFVHFSQNHAALPGYELAVRLTKFWLAVATWDPRSMEPVTLKEMVEGAMRVQFERENYVYMNVLMCTVFGSTQPFQPELRRALIDALARAFPHLDDNDLSSFMWHSYLLPGCATDSECIPRILADPETRTRLLRLEPFRRGKWDSLLLNTRHGIAYFRRWLATYPAKKAASRLEQATTDAELLQIIASLSPGTIIPATIFGGISVRQRLTRLIESLLDEPLCPYCRYHPKNGSWTGITLQKTPRLNLLRPHSYLQVPGLVLRLLLHNQPEDGGDAGTNADGEIVYELCDDVVFFLKARAWSKGGFNIDKMLSLVYPSMANERTIRRCEDSRDETAMTPPPLLKRTEEGLPGQVA